MTARLYAPFTTWEMTEKDRKRPQRGRYFAAWTLANGEMPRKGERMTPDIFLEGQVYTVDVKDCRRNAKEQEKADAEIYSKVTEIVSVSQAPNPESFNQESRIREPTNQAINQSGLASS